MIKLLRKKVELLKQLVPFSEEQLNLVKKEEVTRLLELLQHKQCLLSEFEKLEEELTPLRENGPEKWAWKTEADRIEAGKILSQCETLLEKIVQLDTESTETMEEQKTDLSQQIQRVRNGARIFSTYERMNAIEGGVQRFDRMSE